MQYLTFLFPSFRYIELLFNPRNQFEVYVSDFMRFIHPYIAFVTFRFHVEKCREIGKCTAIFGNVELMSGCVA